MVRPVLAIAIALFLAGCLIGAHADDGADQIAGDWQQIESNAGACPKCRLSFQRRGSSLAVTANNGWLASVVMEQQTISARATGVGRWGSNATRVYAGQPFNVEFTLKGQRLYMSMRVDLADGSRRTIRAVYGRVWVGV